MARNFLNLNLTAWRAVRQRHVGTIMDRSARWRYAVTARWLSTLEKSGGFNRPVSGNLPPLVLIAGHWRSGTSLLHELISAHPAFAFPSTYACFNPQAFILTGGRQPVLAGNEGTRPMDAMATRADLPQEDEFALLCLGAPSPYEAMLVPGGISAVVERSLPSCWNAVERAAWAQAFHRFVTACTARTPGHPLVLKSPGHSFRIEQIVSMAPGSRVIFLVRDPRYVIGSTIKMWRAMWKYYAIASVPAHPVELFAEVAVELDRAMEAQTHEMPSGHIMRLRYEDLVGDMSAYVRSTFEFLGQDSSRLPDAVLKRLAAAQNYTRSQGCAPEITRVVERRCADLLHKYGYCSGSP